MFFVVKEKERENTDLQTLYGIIFGSQKTFQENVNLERKTYDRSL